MSVPFKPHAVTIYPTNPLLEGAVIVGHEDGEGTPRMGMLAPTKSEEVYENYGVTVKRGWVYMDDPDAEPFLVEGGRIEWGSRRFAIMGGPLLFTGFGACDNVSVPLEEIVVGAAPSENP